MNPLDTLDKAGELLQLVRIIVALGVLGFLVMLLRAFRLTWLLGPVALIAVTLGVTKSAVAINSRPECQSEASSVVVNQPDVATPSPVGANRGGVDPEVIREMAAAARKVGLDGERLRVSVAIAMAESSGRRFAENRVGEKSIGWWQINMAAHGDRYGSVATLHTADGNAKAMYAISSGGSNWGPWTTYTSGAYRQHLAAVDDALGTEPVAARCGAIAVVNHFRGGLAAMWVGKRDVMPLGAVVDPAVNLMLDPLAKTVGADECADRNDDPWCSDLGLGAVQPQTLAFARALVAEFGVGEGLAGMRDVKDDTIKGGGPHTTGHAVDRYVVDQTDGDTVVRWAMKRSDVDHLIWNGWTWSPDLGWRHYTEPGAGYGCECRPSGEGDHADHVHFVIR